MNFVRPAFAAAILIAALGTASAQNREELETGIHGNTRDGRSIDESRPTGVCVQQRVPRGFVKLARHTVLARMGSRPIALRCQR